MTTAPLMASPPPSPESSTELFRPLLLRRAEALVDAIRAAVPGYASSRGGRRHHLMSMAADAAVRAHLDTGATGDRERRKVDELFRKMGWGEGREGHGTDRLEDALRAATREAWNQMADFAAARAIPTADLRVAAGRLFDYSDRLRREMLTGHALGAGTETKDLARARAHLWSTLEAMTPDPLLVTRVTPAAVQQAARDAQWEVPPEVVALAVTFHGPPPEIARPWLLHRVEGQRMQVVCPAHEAVEVAHLIERSGTDRRVVVSWPVPVFDVGTALQWTLRALDLIALGVIAPTPVVHCTDHVTQLWLHSEPSMRQRLCQELLEPLLGETPNSREILSETLLVWLETRDSAPGIAARLDVHPQTVRYRWRRINELFGEVLHEPELVLQMTLVLKASVPLWKGGDQSDFERFRDNREGDR